MINWELIVDNIVPRIILAIEAATEYLTTHTNESKVRTTLMLAELEEAGVKAEQAEQEAAKAGGAVGMMRAPYGYCCECGERNVERHGGHGDNNSYDTCPRGHANPSTQSTIRPIRPPKPDPRPIEVIRNDQTTVPDSEI